MDSNIVIRLFYTMNSQLKHPDYHPIRYRDSISSNSDVVAISGWSPVQDYY